MRSIIFATGIFGIAGITLVDYRLAKTRVADCNFYSDCVHRAVAQRDAVLVHGLIALLAFVLVSLIVVAVIRARQPQGTAPSRVRPAKPERRPLLRS